MFFFLMPFEANIPLLEWPSLWSFKKNSWHNKSWVKFVAILFRREHFAQNLKKSKLRIFVRLKIFGYFQKINSSKQALKYLLWRSLLWTKRCGVKKSVFSSLSWDEIKNTPLAQLHSRQLQNLVFENLCRAEVVKCSCRIYVLI